MNHYQFQEAPVSCSACGWSGTGKETAIGETFSELDEYHCPSCKTKLGTCMYPTVAEAQKRREAGIKAATTKGSEEDKREALMTAWTRKNGKDDVRDPFSRQNSAPQATAGAAPRVPAEVLRKLEEHFHAVIRGRAGNLIDEHGVQLPTLALLLTQAEPKAWFPVPGMYGGFHYWLEGHGEDTRLVSESCPPASCPPTTRGFRFALAV